MRASRRVICCGDELEVSAEVPSAIIVIHRDGHVEFLTGTYTIDSREPEFEPTVLCRNDIMEITVLTHEIVREVRAAPVSEPQRRVDLRIDRRDPTLPTTRFSLRRPTACLRASTVSTSSARRVSPNGSSAIAYDARRNILYATATNSTDVLALNRASALFGSLHHGEFTIGDDSRRNIASQGPWVLFLGRDSLRADKIFVGTQGGATLLDGGGCRNLQGLPNPCVHTMERYSSGLWVGTEGGLALHRWPPNDPTSRLRARSTASLQD